MEFTDVDLADGTELTAPVEKDATSPVEKAAVCERRGGEGGRRAAALLAWWTCRLVERRGGGEEGTVKSAVAEAVQACSKAWSLSPSFMQSESPSHWGTRTTLPLSLMQLDGPMHMLFWTDATAREGAWRSNMHGRSTCVSIRTVRTPAWTNKNTNTYAENRRVHSCKRACIRIRIHT
jgi:hypothetical protein